jgi:hypothetical protein
VSKPYRCLSFTETTADPNICVWCKETKDQHIDFDRDWKPPPIDDEYREKRGIELVQLRGPETNDAESD